VADAGNRGLDEVCAELRGRTEFDRGGFSTLQSSGFMLPGMALSARNRLAGEIIELEFGGVMAHVVVRVGKDMIESVITKRSAEEMKLKIGDKVSAVIKSTEVMLEKS
jgi:molybdopterin-binding protein